jgi:hypothetical protein
MTAGGGGKREAIQAFQYGASDRHCRRFPERIAMDPHSKLALRSKPQIAAHSETSKPKQLIVTINISEGSK